jgi:hypothetical protein
MFYSENRLHDDGCFKQDRERQSSSVGDYLTLGLVPQGNCGENVAKIAACHPNLVSKNGYGMASACAIDDDSKMRFGATQNQPQASAATDPVYHGHPHYEKGVSLQIPRVAPSIPAHTRTMMWSTFGIEIDRFEPLIPCIESVVQDPQHT